MYVYVGIWRHFSRRDIYMYFALNLGSVFPVTGPSYLTDLLDHAMDREQRSAYPWRPRYGTRCSAWAKIGEPKSLPSIRILCGKGRARFPILAAILNLLTLVSPSRKEKKKKILLGVLYRTCKLKGQTGVGARGGTTNMPESD